MSRQGARLPAAERRASLLETACSVFCAGSYRSTTTAEIAREAGVTEPILYRHFDSKRDLYLSCLQETWEDLRVRWEEAIEAEPDSANWLQALARTFFQAERSRSVISSLWVQSLAEAGDDEEIRRFMQRHMREVHGFVADVIRRGQEHGGILPDRDPRAEAWLFLSLGLLKMISFRLKGLVEDDFAAIVASRRLWLTGRDVSGGHGAVR